MNLEKIKSFLNYDPSNGEFRWKVKRKAMNAGDLTGARLTKANRYCRVNVNKKNWLAHRLAWFMHYGEEAKGIIDHINGDPVDNRITNLRLTDSFGNNRNRKVHREGMPFGIYRRGSRWAAHAVVQKKNNWLGTHDCPLMAKLAVTKFWKQFEKGVL